MMVLPEELSGVTLHELQKRTALESLERRILLCHALQLTRAQLIAQSERVVTAEEAQGLADLFNRRLAGEPIAYLTGTREFYGLAFHVTPDVLIPRPETELLVDLAIARLPQGGRVLDMGTGSGAIAIAIAHARPDVSVVASDVSLAALRVAQDNADRILSGRQNAIRFLPSDWYAGFGEEDRFDVIVSNPPYIAANDPHLTQGDLRFEPANALTDHGDGLSAYRALAAGARDYLESGGWLLVEHGFEQAMPIQELLLSNRFEAVQTWKDLAGLARVTGGHSAAEGH
ncbi:MAG: peptide chain release factor N(5)-glutamine methyltransferase [Oxalobacter sp.]|nr:MAG: peptide chain release factor N(5)-glutamine methyltransferase [Oxalobacter sp.]